MFKDTPGWIKGYFQIWKKTEVKNNNNRKGHQGKQRFTLRHSDAFSRGIAPTLITTVKYRGAERSQPWQRHNRNNTYCSFPHDRGERGCHKRKETRTQTN